MFAFSSKSAEYLHKFELFISQGIVAMCLRWGGRCHMGFEANFIRFPAVQKLWKSVKIWQCYREFKDGNFFWDTVYIKQSRAIRFYFKVPSSEATIEWLNNIEFTNFICSLTWTNEAGSGGSQVLQIIIVIKKLRSKSCCLSVCFNAIVIVEVVYFRLLASPYITELARWQNVISLNNYFHQINSIQKRYRRLPRVIFTNDSAFVTL